MAYAKYVSEVAEAYLAIVDAAATGLGIQDTFYGNQVKFPRTPAVVVEPDTKTAELRNAPRGVENVFRVEVMIVHMQVQDNQTNRREADALSNAVEDLFNANANKNLGGLVVHQFVVRVQSGFVNRENSTFMSTKITLEAMNLNQLPFSLP